MVPGQEKIPYVKVKKAMSNDEARNPGVEYLAIRRSLMLENYQYRSNLYHQ